MTTTPFNAATAPRIEDLARRATATARAFASGREAGDLDAAQGVLAECRFFVRGMADTDDENAKHAYRERLLRFLGDSAGIVSRAQWASLWDCLDEGGVSRAEARGFTEAP